MAQNTTNNDPRVMMMMMMDDDDDTDNIVRRNVSINGIDNDNGERRNQVIFNQNECSIDVNKYIGKSTEYQTTNHYN
jgi:hypothetical protein